MAISQAHPVRHRRRQQLLLKSPSEAITPGTENRPVAQKISSRVTSVGSLRKPLDISPLALFSISKVRRRPLDSVHVHIHSCPALYPSIFFSFLRRNMSSSVKLVVDIYWCLTGRFDCATDRFHGGLASLSRTLRPLECLSTLLSTPHCFLLWFDSPQLFLSRRTLSSDCQCIL